MNTYSPKVSIIVPTYNRAALLRETVESILAQTFEDFELIIVDNLSEDGTETYVRSVGDPRVRYLKNSNRGIIAINRNLGIREARGPYVAFCDDDDLWLPQKLERQMHYFSEAGLSCVATNYIPFGDLRFIRKILSFSHESLFRDFTYEEILSENLVISSSVVTRRDFLLQTGGFDESLDFRFIEDWELWLRLAKKGKIRIVAEPLLKYRMVRKENRDEGRIRLNTLKIIEKHSKLGYLNESIKKKAEGNCFVAIGTAFLEANNREGLKFYRRGLVDSQGWYNRLKSLAGIFLFYTPLSFRKRFLNFLFAFATHG